MMRPRGSVAKAGTVIGDLPTTAPRLLVGYDREVVRALVRFGVLLLLGSLGCAAHDAEPATAAEASGGQTPSSWAVEPAASGGHEASRAPAPPSTVMVESAAGREPPRWAVRQIDRPAEPLPARPRRVGRRDVRFEGATLENAFRLLADAGRFDLVLDGDFGQAVSQVLRNVEPYDALLALAEAHGAWVSCRGTVVTVSQRQP
ncbi:MAG: hypothetical protein JRI23_28390 [Deltaproteobacteria bacterium]|jgi:hypothetical protein|nr:hypothetical protein [Deltaproteobacteria bacterium]MBW2536016.1 hypothetical protein [Deltaproteobacteria bacterium]